MCWSHRHGGKIPLDGLGKRELFTLCEVVQEREALCRQPYGTRLTGITPGRTNHRVQLLPLGRIQAPVTPLLELLGGRVVEGARLPGGLAALRPHPPVHHRGILVADLVTWSWHTTPQAIA